MKKLCTKERLLHLLFLLVRVGLAYYFIPQGWKKLMGGPKTWLWLGQQMGNIGIHFAPVVWGFAAACAEFCGGMALLVGYRTRVASVFMVFVMFVAIIMHTMKGDPITTTLFPVYFLLLFLILLFTGAGRYSLDYWLAKKQVGEDE